MKEKIADILAKELNKKEAEIISLIETPPDTNLGDFAFPCFSLAKELRKNPVEIAKDLARNLKPTREIEKVIANGPYLNFFLNPVCFAEKIINNILTKKEEYGNIKISSERIMIEFSSPNTHKAFHVGHIRGTSLGESIARILAFTGNKVIRANYSGDTGMHIAKWIWCYKKFHSKEKLSDDESWIAKIYTNAVRQLAEHPEFEPEVEEINRKLESREDKELLALWKKTRELSIISWKKIYSELNTKFDIHFFESEVEKEGKRIGQELVKKGIAEVSEGATIVNLEKYNLGVWVVLRSDGTVLYSAKDLALAELKFNEYKISKSLYVVGKEQEMYFHQLFKVLELMKFKQAKNCVYVPLNEVRLPTGKMSSRTGDNILYSDFIKEITSYAKEEIKKREKLSETEFDKRALAIAIASIKYSMLKQDVNKGIIFDKEEALRFEGDTGPYILYTYARARSILRKAKYEQKKLSNLSAINDSEKQIILALSKFSEIIKNASAQLAPNLIAHYAYQLSQLFNEFYHANKVIGSDNEEFRLALVNTVSQLIKNSLALLGIQAIERM